MPLMTLKATRVVDPILTTVVQGYVQPEFVGNALFPPVPVSKRAGYVIEFGKEDFALFDTRRAPGAATKRRNINYGNRSYNLYQDRLEGELPREHIEESEGLGFNLQTETAESTMRSIQLRLEYDQAAIATNAANYDANHKVVLSGTSKWSDPNSDPAGDIRSWKQAIRGTIGTYGNTLLLGAKVFDTFVEHEQTKDKIKHTSSASITADAIAAMFNLDKVVVASPLILNNETGQLVDIWGDVAILAYVPQRVQSRRQPSYGYTYTLQGYPMVERPYYDDNHASFYYPVTAERSPELVGQSAGFLAQGLL
ncbi:major capsid protein [Chroococcidiopsis sp.]|uniref:major capsid protein n=1 Tax=Chroococcidiopsis sp. TaxID=3088168 RepID=UPI003F351377